MKTIRISLALVFAIAVLPVPEAFSAPGVYSWNRDCIRFYSQWKKRPKHRAFAVSNGSGGQACGGTWGAPSAKAARDGATKWCKKATQNGDSCRVTQVD